MRDWWNELSTRRKYYLGGIVLLLSAVIVHFMRLPHRTESSLLVRFIMFGCISFIVGYMLPKDYDEMP